jgi:hypothetical protein
MVDNRSLRKESYNRKVCETLARLAPSGVAMEFIDIAQLAHFNPDHESMPPTEYIDQRLIAQQWRIWGAQTPAPNPRLPGYALHDRAGNLYPERG